MLVPRWTRLAWLTLGALALASAAACSSASYPATPTSTATATATVQPVAFSTTDVRVGSRALHVEVASAAAQTERGLGYRDSLPADDGMIFDLHGTRVPSFWTKGMRFALDFVWIDDAKNVASVTTDVPPEAGVGDDALRRYSPDTAVRYVIEVNAGAAHRLGLTPGTQLMFELSPGVLD